MKKVLIIILMFFSSLVLFGCDSSNSQNQGNDSNNSNTTQGHTHNYSSQVVAPTCSKKGYTIHSCSCGSSYIDSYVNANGHTWVEGEKNYYCSKCNQSEAEYFEFNLVSSSSEPYYIVTKAKADALINETIEIPRKYESLPVKIISGYALTPVTKQIKKLIIHDNIKVLYNDMMHGYSIWEPDWETMSSLQEVVFDETCNNLNISANAFNNCPSLSKVNLKKGMVLYASTTNDGTSTTNGGTAEYLFKSTPYFNNNAIVKKGLYYIADLLLYANLNEVESDVVIESGTISINSCIFNKCTTIKSVTIPSSVTLIGMSAFRHCINLETIRYEGTIEQFNKIKTGLYSFSDLKAKTIICSDGTLSKYKSYNTTKNVGE